MSWLERLTQVLLREPHDRKELLDLLRDSKKRKLLDAHALRMIEGVLHVSEMQVRDIMLPRSQLVLLEHDAKLEEFLPILVQSGHSRFPVIGENRDEVIGILLAKDVLKHFTGEKTPFKITEHLRPAVLVPESKRLDTLLQEFRLKRNHMAIVIDEYGGFAGLVTIEDVLEQIVGKIEDEFDVDETPNISQKTDTQFIVKGLTPINEFNQFFNADFSDEEFDTIGGYITHELGHLPTDKETVSLAHLRFKVLQADERRLQLLQVTVRRKR